MPKDDLISKIHLKYQDLGENSQTYLNGLLHAKPLNYWDYIEVETLLSLQKPRTNFLATNGISYNSYYYNSHIHVSNRYFCKNWWYIKKQH